MVEEQQNSETGAVGLSLMRWYERAVLRHPIRVLVIAAAVLLLAAVRVSETRIETSADSLVLEGDAALQYYREVRWRYPESEFLLVSWSPRQGDLLVADNLQRLAALNEELRAISGVAGVTSLLDVPLLSSPPQPLGELIRNLRTLSEDPNTDPELVRAEFRDSPLYRSLVANQALDAAAIQILMQPNSLYNELLREREALRAQALQRQLSTVEQQRLSEVSAAFKRQEAQASVTRDALVAEVRTVLRRHEDGAHIFLGGVPMITSDMVAFVRSDMLTFGTAILLLFVVLLGIIFRRLRWVLLPLLNCVVVALFMLGVLVWMGWNMTVVSANFLVLLLIITLSFSVHLMVRFRELQALHPDWTSLELSRETVRFMSVPCMFMALTTMVSFVSLFYSGVRPVIDFGWMLAIGTAAALLWVFVLLPSWLVLLPKAPAVAAAADPSAAFTARFAAFVERFGTAILWVSLLLAVLAAIGISRLEVETRFIDYFDPSTEIYRGMEVIDRELGGTIPLEVVLKQRPTTVDDAGDGDASESFEDDFGDDFGEIGEETELPPWFDSIGLERIEAVHDYLDSLPETGKVLSPATVWKLARQLLGHRPSDLELALLHGGLPEDSRRLLLDPYLNAENNEARIVLRVKETSRELRRDEFLERVQQHLTEELGFAPEELQLTGLLVLYNNLLQSLYRSQILTLGLVALSILTMFLFLFRSLSLAVLALIPNLLAACLVLGGMGLIGLPLDLMTVTIAAIVLGIGVDNTIHYVWRFRREFARDRNYLAAMHRAHGSIGRAMYYTSVTVVFGFLLLTLSNFRPSIYFGLLTAAAMAAALLGALVLLPQLLRTFRPLGPE